MIRLDDTLNILANLVRFNSVSPNYNARLTAYIGAFMQDCGADVYSVLLAGGPKGHLIATMGPRDQSGGIVLSGHMDVVTVENQNWHTDPWELTEKQGRYIGRGTADMKGYLACMMSLAQELIGQELVKPISFVFSCDEEVSGTAIDPALASLVKLHAAPELCVLGEPTSMEVAYAHKSRAWVKVRSRATGGHPSEIDKEGITSAHVLMRRFETAIDDEMGPQIRAVLGSAQTMGPASLVTTCVKNGEASNSIPAQEEINIDIRARSGLCWDDVVGVLQPVADRIVSHYTDEKKGPATLEMEGRVCSPGFLCLSKPAIDLARAFAQTGLKTADFVTEAPNYIQAGFANTIICGPGASSQAHKPDESIGAEDLVRCNAMMMRLHDFLRTGQRPRLAI